MAIQIEKSLQPQLLASIQRYCREELDTDIGELQASLMLDFIVREIGPPIYNQAVLDAQAKMLQYAEALPETCFEVALGYWSKKAR